MYQNRMRLIGWRIASGGEGMSRGKERTTMERKTMTPCDAAKHPQHLQVVQAAPNHRTPFYEQTTHQTFWARSQDLSPPLRSRYLRIPWSPMSFEILSRRWTHVATKPNRLSLAPIAIVIARKLLRAPRLSRNLHQTLSIH